MDPRKHARTALAALGTLSLLTAPALAEEVPVSAGYDKGFYVRSDDGSFELKTQGRVQVRFTYEGLDGGEGGEDESEANFALQRARLKMKGHAYTEDLTYQLQIDAGKGDVTLKDYYLDYEFADAMHVRVGQYKVPFSRQELTSSGSQEFVDRALTAKGFGAGRDIGLMVHNNFSKSPEFEWAIGVFNGTGEKGRLSGDVEVDPTTGEGDVTGGGFGNVPDEFDPALVARVGYNAGKFKGYSEADLEGGDLRWGVGASGRLDLDGKDGANATTTSAEVDLAAKVEGLSLGAELFVRAEEDFGPGSELTDQVQQAIGFRAQAGYLIADRYQPAVRYAMVDPRGDDNTAQEISLGLSVYFWGHDVKWQTDGSLLLEEDGNEDLEDVRIRSQVQLAF